MHLKHLSSHESTASVNPEFYLIPENVKANPHMFHGWRDGLLWALINPRLLEQFYRETGADIAFWSHGIGAFITPDRGLQLAEISMFVAWYNRTVWEPGK